MVAQRVAQDDCQNGYILDGVPRTIAQAEELEKAGITFDHVISIETDDAVIRDRLTGRRVCPGCGATFHVTGNPPRTEGVCDVCGEKLIQRKDDAADTIAHRLEIYHSETEPLKEFYAERGLLRAVKDTGGIDSTNAIIMDILGK